MNDDNSTAFAEASQLLAHAVCSVPDDAWTSPGLGSWTVLELVAHANRAHTTVEDYLLHPQPAQAPDSPYFKPEAIAQRAREAVAALGNAPARAVADASERVRELVAATPATAPLGSPAGTQTLADYLPSRTAELVIHALDLSNATGVPLEVPLPALTVTLVFLAQRVSSRPGSVQVLRALTGRDVLPTGYSVF